MIIIAETKRENEKVEKLAKELGARYYKREGTYGLTCWSVDDVRGHNLNLTEEGAEAFLERYENRLSEACIEGGNNFLQYADYSGYKLISDVEEFDLIEVCDQVALFTNGRINKWQVPEGLYLYHLRECGEETFAAIEENVVVDHSGSILCKEPIDLGDKKFIDFIENEDLSPNFLGDEISLRDYLDGNYSVD